MVDGTARPVGGVTRVPIEADVVVDTTAPEVDADFVHGDPFPNGTVTPTGQATDNVAVEWIGVAIQRLDTRLWPQDDGVSWGHFNRFEADLDDPGAPAVKWSFAVDLPDDRDMLSLRARDPATNKGRIVPGRLFVVGDDATSPTVDADFAHDTDFTSPVMLTGTATDNTGVAWVRIAIQDVDTKLWLRDDLASWGPFDRMPATLSEPRAVSTAWPFEWSFRRAITCCPQERWTWRATVKSSGRGEGAYRLS